MNRFRDNFIKVDQSFILRMLQSHNLTGKLIHSNWDTGFQFETNYKDINIDDMFIEYDYIIFGKMNGLISIDIYYKQKNQNMRTGYINSLLLLEKVVNG